MNQGMADQLLALGPPPWRVNPNTIAELFRGAVPRDITRRAHHKTPSWVLGSQGGQLYRLYWQNVPLIIPAEATMFREGYDPDVTGYIRWGGSSEELRNILDFFDTYFHDVNHPSRMRDVQSVFFELPLIWQFQETTDGSSYPFPAVDPLMISRLFEVFDELRCWDKPIVNRKRLTVTLLWMDPREKRHHGGTKRNIQRDSGIEQAVMGVIDEALDIWSNHLAGNVYQDLAKYDLNARLANQTIDFLLGLWSRDARKCGYVEYMMMEAFEVAQDLEWDEDVRSYAKAFDGDTDSMVPDASRLEPAAGDAGRDWWARLDDAAAVHCWIESHPSNVQLR